MKLATDTTVPNFKALRELTSLHDAGYEAVKLTRTRAIYAALYQRMLDTLHIDDEGYELTITLRSPSKTLTLNNAEADACFNLSDVYGVQGKRMDALSAEILDMLSGAKNDAFAGTDDPQMMQAHALCLPQMEAATDSAHADPTRRAA